jgi:hypothetical protein
MGRVGYVTAMWEQRNADRILVGKLRNRLFYT